MCSCFIVFLWSYTQHYDSILWLREYLDSCFDCCYNAALKHVGFIAFFGRLCIRLRKSGRVSQRSISYVVAARLTPVSLAGRSTTWLLECKHYCRSADATSIRPVVTTNSRWIYYIWTSTHPVITGASYEQLRHLQLLCRLRDCRGLRDCLTRTRMSLRSIPVLIRQRTRAVDLIPKDAVKNSRCHSVATVLLRYPQYITLDSAATALQPLQSL